MATKHGETRSGGHRSIEYGIWHGMIQRCEDPNGRHWKNYGGRGISVCPRWRANFSDFLADMGRRPSAEHSIDRYPNNDGNYEPGNCRWATRAEQARNRRNNRRVGSSIATDVAIAAGMNPSTLIKRLERGMSVTDALSVPLRQAPLRMLDVGGVKKSVAAWAAEYGIPATTVYARLDEGWSALDALTVNPGARGTGRKATVRVTAHGKTQTIAEWAKETGIKENTIRERLRLHADWTPERIVQK